MTTYDWKPAHPLPGRRPGVYGAVFGQRGRQDQLDPNNQELELVQIHALEQYQQHPPTIVTTHDVQNCSDTEPSAIKLSKQGQKLWELVKGYDQVFMMVVATATAPV